MSPEEILKRLEDLVKMYEKTQELELKKAELAAKTAHTILAENRKSQVELLSVLSQFVGSNSKITPPSNVESSNDIVK